MPDEKRTPKYPTLTVGKLKTIGFEVEVMEDKNVIALSGTTCFWPEAPPCRLVLGPLGTFWAAPEKAMLQLIEECIREMKDYAEKNKDQHKFGSLLQMQKSLGVIATKVGMN